MIKRLTFICLVAALSGCSAPVPPKGVKVGGEALVALLAGATIHGMHGTPGTENLLNFTYVETYHPDGSFELTEFENSNSTASQGDKSYGEWSVSRDRLCYDKEESPDLACVFIYKNGDSISYVNVSSGKILAFSTKIEHGSTATSIIPSTPQAPQKRKLELAGTGTGFVVNTETFLLTNAHVIDGCRQVRVRSRDRNLVAIVASQDSKNDLALLRLPPEIQPVAVFQGLNTLYPGDSVVAVGFPLRGVLASEANVTVGTVSALAGLRNDISKLQVSAPIQPGNSGGPLFDKSGLVVGVIVSTFGSKTNMEKLGVVPQNINFAIKSEVAMALMRASDVEFTQIKSTKSLAPADVARQARKFTLPIECWA